MELATGGLPAGRIKPIETHEKIVVKYARAALTCDEYRRT